MQHLSLFNDPNGVNIAQCYIFQAMTGEPSFDQIQPSSLMDALKIDGNQFEDFIRSIGAKSLGLYIKICLPHVFIDY